jgi:outer membrane protein TolC
MNRVAAPWALLLIALMFPLRATAQAPLTEAQAMQLAIDRNPSLRAAILELQSARLTVESESARYEPVLLLDAGLTRSESPSLTETGTSTSGGTNVDAGVGARKPFPWGTSLTLRLGGRYQRSDARILSTSVGQFNQSALGPGYGLNARLTLAQP